MDHASDHPGFIHLHPLRGGRIQWLHMSVDSPDTATFLKEDADLNAQVVEALLEEDTRSRNRITENGIMVLLKATVSEDIRMPTTDELITMRVWIDEGRVISTQERDSDPILRLDETLNIGGGPSTSTEFLTDLLEFHISGFDHIVEQAEDDIRSLDELIVQGKLDELCSLLADVQKRTTTLLRHLSPQRQVLERLVSAEHRLIDDTARGQFEGHLNHLLRLLETLQAIRERADILHSQHERILDRDQSRVAHLFAVIATVFLPLGFITGMWGVNLNGIPMAEHAEGFSILIAICFVLMIVLLLLFKFRRMF